MAIVTLDLIKLQLNIAADATEDDDLLTAKIAASQNHIERQLGFRIETEFGGTGQDPVPASLIEAVCQLAAHWYENREASLVGVNGSEIPFGVRQIVDDYRRYSFDG